MGNVSKTSIVDLRIILTSVDKALNDAWQRWCGDLRFVEVHHGSIFEINCDAVVSPANSFGFMDCGIVRHYTDFFGPSVQERLQKCIQCCHHGELLVGQADLVATGHDRFAYLVAAPTMRVPTSLAPLIHYYLAASAVFLLLLRGRFTCGDMVGQPIAGKVRSVAFPGLGTGVGRVPPSTCARQMRAAIEDFLLGKLEFPKSTMQARKRHDKLIER
jgi:O-acetyl-ADP-ribose deacetylase (regulator of RNase III)